MENKEPVRLISLSDVLNLLASERRIVKSPEEYELLSVLLQKVKNLPLHSSSSL